ncbi:lectin-like [Polypterus senegalus]|uniref:lectin-like n=1 Tax=Polypterus senegalus TaxID=55291 RepID=UPI0019623B56|nr:lectin-like [Polypterus senegalus]
MAATLGLLLATFIISTVTDVSYSFEICQPGWEDYHTKCYKYFSMRKTWIDAESYCGSLGGNLASVHSSGENYFITKLIKRSDSHEPITWLGGSNSVQISSWLWTDGSKWDFVNWYPGEPNNSGGNEHCLHTNFDAQGGWNDINCGYQYSFVCVRNEWQMLKIKNEGSHERH